MRCGVVWYMTCIINLHKFQKNYLEIIVRKKRSIIYSFFFNFLFKYFFFYSRKPQPRKAYFVGPGEWVKLWLSQALIRDARPDSNSRPAMQISNPLSSPHAHWRLFSFQTATRELLKCYLYTLNHIVPPSNTYNPLLYGHKLISHQQECQTTETIWLQFQSFSPPLFSINQSA
jgi:hypothetical protein